MAHQLNCRLLLRNSDILHKLALGLVARNLHYGDGRHARQIHIRCTATASRMSLDQVALLDKSLAALALLDIRHLDLRGDTRPTCHLLDIFVHLLLVAQRQTIAIFI